MSHQEVETGKNVKFHDSVYDVALRTNKSENRRSRRQAYVWSTIQDQLTVEQDLWCFKIRRSSIVKVICWITLVIFFTYGYFLDYWTKFYKDTTNFSFYKRSVEKLEAPALTVCMNPGFKGSVLAQLEGYEDLGDYIFMSDDYINGTGSFNVKIFANDSDHDIAQAMIIQNQKSWSDGMKDLYNNASFHIGLDYNVKACHTEMEHIERRLGGHGPDACKELILGSNNVPLKGGQKAVIKVSEIPTICCGICIAIETKGLAHTSLFTFKIQQKKDRNPAKSEVKPKVHQQSKESKAKENKRLKSACRELVENEILNNDLNITNFGQNYTSNGQIANGRNATGKNITEPKVMVIRQYIVCEVTKVRHEDQTVTLKPKKDFQDPLYSAEVTFLSSNNIYYIIDNELLKTLDNPYKVSLDLWGKTEMSVTLNQRVQINHGDDCIKTNQSSMVGAGLDCRINNILSDINKLQKCDSKCLPMKYYGLREMLATYGIKLQRCARPKDERCMIRVIDAEFESGECENVCEQKSFMGNHRTVKKKPSKKSGTCGTLRTFINDRTEEVKEEYLVFDTLGFLGTVGGTLSLFLGFSFYSIIEFIVNYLRDLPAAL